VILDTMAIGGDSCRVVVRHTFVEVVHTDNKHVRAKSEGGMSLPTLPITPPRLMTNAQATTQTRLTGFPQSVARTPSRPRPSVSKEEGALSKYLSRSQKGGWCAKFCNAVGHKTDEDDGQRLKDVQNSFAHGPLSRDTRWHVVNTHLVLGVGFRSEPLSSAPRVQPEDGVKAGETFQVSEQRVGKDGVLHLRVAGGCGWVPSTKPNGEILCERVIEAQDDLSNRSSSFSWDDVTEEELGDRNKDEEHRTTVVITDIASNCTRDGLLAQLDASGLAGQYDFVYLPVSFETLATHGYGIVNFVSSHAAQMLMKKSPNSVSFSDQRQGLEGHVANFQDSSLMHEGVPDQFKPLLFQNGRRIPFPPPTRPTRMPRELKRAIWRMKNGELASDGAQLQNLDVSTPKSQPDQCSPRCLKSPNDRRGGRVANSRRARSRRDLDSCA